MIYKCSVCGYVFDEEKEGRSISDLTECPVCRQPADRFVPVDGGIRRSVLMEAVCRTSGRSFSRRRRSCGRYTGAGIRSPVLSHFIGYFGRFVRKCFLP